MFTDAKIIAVDADPNLYHKQPDVRGSAKFEMSSSSLRSFWASPSKWVEPIRAQDGTITYYEHPGSKSTEWGNLFDCVLLTPSQFESRYAVSPAQYDATENTCPGCGSVAPAKRCKACDTERLPKLVQKPWSGQSGHCKKWKETREAEGKTVCSHKEYYDVQQAVARFRRDPHLCRFIDCSQRQVWITAIWVDKETGLSVPVKCLIDVVPTVGSELEKALGDVKTCKSAARSAWESWCHAAGYEVQAAWNTDMLVAASGGREITEFRFLLSENTAPWEPGRRTMTNELIDPERDMGDIASGRRQYRRIMAAYCKCLKTGKWPGYDDHEDAYDGWTIITPNPYKEMARDEAPKLLFGEEPDPEEGEPEPDLIP